MEHYDSLIDELVLLRRELHSNPERSGHEEGTAAFISDRLARYSPDDLLVQVGGHGVVAIYEGTQDGPTVLIRAELDGLPIRECSTVPYRSANPGISHACGHDGHMAALVGLAARLHLSPPDSGRVVLLFQPSEETGKGAARVLEDPQFSSLRTDFAFAWHNLPGYAEGALVLRDGVFATASQGLAVHLRGETSHASEPHLGNNPAMAVAQLISTLSAAPQMVASLDESAQSTVIHAHLGQPAFGSSPGEAVVMATLRAHDDRVMQCLMNYCSARALGLGEAHGLVVDVDSVEPFVATVNDPETNSLVELAAATLRMQTIRPASPFPWSEDFGTFLKHTNGALFGLGAGESAAPLHAAQYDFPDLLLRPAVRFLEQLVNNLLGKAEDAPGGNQGGSA